MRKLTDQQLREDLDRGLIPAEIARKHGVSAAAVSKAMKRLDAATVAAAVQPKEAQQFVSQTLDVLGILSQASTRTHLLQDACHEWLKDPENDEKYTLAPRADEVIVTHVVTEWVENAKGELKPKRTREKHTLAELLDRLAEGEIEVAMVERKTADPRDLILRTLQEARSTAMAYAELMEKVVLARRMAAFEDVLVSEIQKVSPEVAQKIADAIRRSHVLCSALGPDTGLPAG